MLRAEIKVGAERITVEHDDQVEFHKLVHLYREMASRVTPDAVIRVRKDDSYEYPEFHSPSLRASKKISTATKSEALVKDAPYYIGFKTPWVRFIYSDKENRSISLLMFDIITEDLREKGFVNKGMWYRAKMVDGKDPVIEDPDFEMSPNELDKLMSRRYQSNDE